MAICLRVCRQSILWKCDIYMCYIKNKVFCKTLAQTTNLVLVKFEPNTYVIWVNIICAKETICKRFENQPLFCLQQQNLILVFYK